MQTLLSSALRDIVAKVEGGERLSPEDGYRLQQSTDVMTVGYMADLVRRRTVGEVAYFINTAQVDLATAELETELSLARTLGARAVQLSGDARPDLPYEHYLEVIRQIRLGMPPGTQVMAYDAATVNQIATGYAGKTVDMVLYDLIEAGATVLGEGSGNLADQADYLHVHGAAHGLGLKSHAAMLYGGSEPFEDRIDYLVALRSLQEQTGGFVCFTNVPAGPTTGILDTMQIAVSRILLDNIPHIRAPWQAHGMKMAQSMLAFGVDDLGGVIHEVNPLSPHESGERGMVYLIKQSGRTPIERDCLFQLLKPW